MYQNVKRKMIFLLIGLILLLSISSLAIPSSKKADESDYENSIIEFDNEYALKFDKRYGAVSEKYVDHIKETNKYDLDKYNISDNLNSGINKTNNNKNEIVQNKSIPDIKLDTTTQDLRVIPLELITTTQNIKTTLSEYDEEPDLTVIPLMSTKAPKANFSTTTDSPTSTENDAPIPAELNDNITEITSDAYIASKSTSTKNDVPIPAVINENITEITSEAYIPSKRSPDYAKRQNDRPLFDYTVTTTEREITTTLAENLTTEVSENIENLENNTDISPDSDILSRSDVDIKDDDEVVPSVVSELDFEDQSDIPDDYYDLKDVVPTRPPSTDALSVIFGLAGSMVESVVGSVAERVVPKGIIDLFRRMQRQSEALEAERLRSREENGGLGQFGRGILKSISTGISKPLSQLMAGVKDIGSLDSDRGFVNSIASGVTSVANYANGLVDAFKDRVQTIYPGTVWCGGGHSAQARSGDLGLFFFTDTCCREHDACKLYINAGDTKYGLTNTGLFTRSHCSCDAKFRDCLRKTNSLVSAQIGLTYFNVLGPQCFRRAHPIVRCLKKTRITGQKCEEYELDYTKPKMWQWFDNETF